MENVYIIEGKNIYDLHSCFKEFAKAVNAPNGYFGSGMNQFDDCLFGGFGLEAPCKIIWKNSSLSKQRLNCKMLRNYYKREKYLYEKELIIEMKELLEHGRKDASVEDCFSYTAIQYSKHMIERAEIGELDLFDEIVNTIRSVSERSYNKNWKIELILE
ncbi:barstar family protein [Acetivibrio cellulolyticus]|uniref:barstar family protein n=1 Tax=Acetivibrio cellulolyticus TaxID=35830 RepID=UPI0001E2F5E0|nr:barstar family protein [Acetivibrio cellulolyticus]